MSQPVATLLGALITGLVALTAAFVTYVLTRRQEEHKVRYARIYEQRAEIIAKLYELLRDLQIDFENWIDMYENWVLEERTARAQLGEVISTKLKQLSSYNRQKALWLDKESHDRIDEVSRNMRIQWRGIVRRASIPSSSRSLNSPNVNTAVQTVRSWINGSLNEALELEIYSEFRAIIGTDAPQRREDIIGNMKSIRRAVVAFKHAVLAGLLIGIGLGILVYSSIGPDYGLVIGTIVGTAGVIVFLNYTLGSLSRRKRDSG